MEYITRYADALIITDKDMSKIATQYNRTLLNNNIKSIINADKTLITEVEANIFIYFLKHADNVVIDDGLIEFSTYNNDIVTQIKTPIFNRVESPITLNARTLLKILKTLKPRDDLEIYKVNIDSKIICFKVDSKDIVFIVERVEP